MKPQGPYLQVSIIVPTLLGGTRLEKCVRSIQRTDYPLKKIRLVVIDNGGRVNAPRLKKDFPNLVVVQNKQNQSFAKSANQGMKKVKSDFYMITNDDIVFGKDSLGILVSYITNHPSVGIVGGRQTKKNGRFLSGGHQFNFLTGIQTNLAKKNRPVDCTYVEGCSMLISSQVIKKIGGFDEKFFPAYYEDADFCVRAKKAGFRIVYHPQAVFYHEHAATTSLFPLKEIYFMGAKNKLLLLVKHANLIQLISFILSHYLIIVPYRLIIRREPILAPEIKAVFWNLKNIKKKFA